MDNKLASAIIREAKRIGADPHDFATVISFETGGTFNPWAKGPRTKWGRHVGLIQMGEPQRKKYGYTPDKDIDALVKSSADYLVDNGFKAGMGLHQMYATINTGSPYKGHLSDAKNGGTWGSANDKVNHQMHGHRKKAAALLGTEDKKIFPTQAGEVSSPIELNPLTPLTAGQPKTHVQQLAEDKARPQEYDHWWDEWGAAFQTHTIASQAWYKFKLSDFDPDWVPDEEEYVEALGRIPENYHPRLMAANSETSFQDTLKWIEEDMIRTERLSKGGWSATVASLGAGLFDPVNFIPVGGAYAAGVKIGSRAGRMAYGAAIGAGTNFALETASKGLFQDPHADPLMGAVVGAGFGTLGGFLMRNPRLRQEAEMVNQLAAKTQNLNPVDVVNLRGNLGAARNPHVMDDLADFMEVDAPKAKFGKVRYDITGTATTSDNPFVRHVGMWMSDETVGLEGHAVVPDSINAKYTADYRLRNHEFITGYVPAKMNWLKSQDFHKLNFMQRMEKEAEFNRLVNEQVWQPLDNVDPHVMKAASTIRKGLDKFADDMREAGLWTGKAQGNYMPLYPDHARIADYDRLVHHEVMEETIKRAIIKHSPDIDDGLASLMAQGYWTRIRKASYGMQNNIDRALAEENRQGFIEAFREALAQNHKYSDADIGRVFDDLVGHVADDGGSEGIRNLKRRTLLDYNYEATIRLRDGSQTRFRVRDLFNQDAELGYRRYMRSMTGRLAFANSPLRHPETGDVIVKGLKSEADLEKLKDMIRESYRQTGKPMSEWDKEMEAVLANTDFLWKRINGIPVQGQEQAWAQWLRRIGSVQFIRLMSNMGLNQIQETVKIFSMLGWRATWQSLPALRSLANDVASGRVHKDRLLAEIEDMSGIGIDNLYRPHDLRMDDDRLGLDVGGRTGAKMDAYLDAGQRITAKLTGFQAIQAFQQRWAAKAITRFMSDLAHKTRASDGSFDLSKITKGDRDRLATSGMGDEDLSRLFADLLAHGEFDGKKIVGINVDQWDAATLSKFRLFLNREVDRLVLQNDYGALPRWMSHPVGKLFVQFRGFVFGAWTKSTLYGLHHFDGKMLTLVLGELVAGMATFAIRTSPALVTEEGRKKWLEDMSDPLKMVAKGWSRTASASILPMLADTALQFAPTSFRFDARASGSATDAFFGNPAIDQATQAASFVRGLGKSALNLEPPTQNTIRSGIRAFVPFGNWIGLQAVLGAMVSPLPEK